MTNHTHKDKTGANHNQNTNWQNFPLMPNLDSVEFEKAATKQDGTTYATVPLLVAADP